ncbi:hypothetical protein F7734_22540 [Scytonema sp. UIC 10036]|nr:hypothetical protein [Scytonema sp. UIC 10036]
MRIGDYRVRYEVDDENQRVQILQCKHRKDVFYPTLTLPL